MIRNIRWWSFVAVVGLCACMPAETKMHDEGDLRPESQSQADPARPHIVTASGEVIELEIARSDQQRARGLMFRESLAPSHGMLFIFAESDRHGFWMKNTFIPLDMIWIEEDGTIAEIQRNIPPCRSDPCPTYAPEEAGLYVLELAADEAERLGLKAGDRLELRNIESRAGG